MTKHLISGRVAATVGVASLALAGFLFAFNQAAAHTSPGGCNASALQEIPVISPSSDVYDGTTLTYTVTYNNLDPDGAGGVSPCDVTGANATITRPDGTVINVLTNASFPVGTTIACPGGAGCAAGPYTYVVAHVNENGSHLVTTNFNISGTLHLGGDTNTASDSDNLSNLVIHPNTTATITPSATAVEAGGTVNLTVTEHNTGDADLTSPSVTVDNGVGSLTKASASFTGGDTGNDGILGVGETWSWTVTGVIINSNTTFTAIGDGLDENGNHVTYPTFVNERAQATVKVVDAQILIDANSTNEVGVDHTFTVTVNTDLGDGNGFVPASGATVTAGVTAPGSLTGTGTCETGTTNASGQCTIIVHSTTPGIGTVSASTTVNISGVSITRELGDGKSGDSAQATKTWVDANIQITPAEDTDPVGDNHVLTAHVNINAGQGAGYVAAPDGTSISFTIQSGPGSFTTTNPCTTTGGTGECTITLTSPTQGTTVVRASTSVVVGGVTLNRATGDAKAGDSADASKNWEKSGSSVVTHIHDASDSIVTSVTVGTSVHDSAIVTPSDATGTVSFQLYSDNNCTTASGSPDVQNVISGVAENGAPATANADLSYKATYSGDDKYNGSTAECEPLSVNKLDSQIVTHIHDANHGVITTANAGDTVHDSAMVTPATTGPVPTGDVLFTFYSNGTCQGDISSNAGTVAVDGTGLADPSTAEGPLAQGSYSFKAHYAGDDKYNPSDAECEPLTVSKQSSSTHTDIHNAAHTVVTSVSVGSVVHDNAQVTPTDATGTVSFQLYSDNNCTTTNGAAEVVALGAGGISESSNTNANAALSYKATYSGDTKYNGSTGDCEPLAVTKLTPTVTTAIHDTAHTTITTATAGDVVHDSATVTGSGATPTGDVTFSFFTSGDCSGTAAATSGTFSLSSGTVDATTFTQTVAAPSASFKAHYAGDSVYLSADGACEPLEVKQLALQYCSPGYWKQSQHFYSYVTYHPNDLFDTVFGVTAFPGKTLVEVLSQGGGGLNAYGRAAVGALLNSTSMNSGLTDAQVIAKVQATIAGAASVSAKQLNGYYGSANPEFTAPENCPLS